MPNIVSLPDGTFMILNGAMQGVAGFGLANNPNFQALLYDPTQPLGSRISFLNTTIVARMYHSEAILLPDGRVLVSGSDPQTDNPDGTVKYPEEFRIEVYIPPYLNQGFTQPTFSIAVTDWTYSGVFTITNVKLFQGTTATMRVSLIAGASMLLCSDIRCVLTWFLRSDVEHARKRDGRAHAVPQIQLQRHDVPDHRAAECRYLAARLASTLHSRRTDAVPLRLGAHRWRPVAARALAEPPWVHRPGRVGPQRRSVRSESPLKRDGLRSYLLGHLSISSFPCLLICPGIIFSFVPRPR